jgi:hypothetical protein
MRNHDRKRLGITGYNKSMFRRIGGAVVGWLVLLSSAAAQTAPPPPSEAILAGLKKAFEARDYDGYAALFGPALREQERQSALSFGDNFKMTQVLFRTAGRIKDQDGRERSYVQVFYQNELAAMLETWKILPLEQEGRWTIVEKEVTGNISTLYKLNLPAARVLKGARVEIRHQDIRLSFENAWVYYDNLPDTETALIVLGDGRVRFEPSRDEEKHQLDLRLGAPVLDDRIDSVYLRFSPSFFKSNITISGGAQPEPNEEARIQATRAYSVFSTNYAASFTTENSLTEERLSFLPQGDQAVFEFRTRQAGRLTYINSPFSDEEIHLVARDSDQIVNLYSPQTGEAGGRKMLVSLSSKTNVLDYQVDVDFDPEKFHISARARVEFSSSEPVESLKFNINPKLDIVRVYDAEGQELFYTQDRYRRILYIYLLRPLAKGRTGAVEIFYRGVVEPTMQMSDVLPSPQRNETLSFVGPLYETYLYSQADLWYPSPPEENFFTAKVRIVVPPGYGCVANGPAVEEGKVDGVRRVTSLDKVGHPYFGFQTKAPVKYLSFIVGRFTRLTNGASGSVPVEARIASDVRAARKGLIEEAKAVLKAYEEWFGAYPFEKLTIVQRQWPSSGGHSPASFVVLNDLPRSIDGLMVTKADNPVDLSRWREAVLAHEIAHQWWGQGVAGATYHDQWLSEGLAQFAAVRYLKSRLGPDAHASALKKFARWTTRKAKWGPILLGSRLSYLDFDAYQALVYDKSALVLEMLADLLGEETFFKGLQEFFAAYKYKAARTAQFRAVMEKVSGRDLQPFFDLWFGAHVLPDVMVGTTVQKKDESYVLQVRVAQRGPAFVFPLWLGWQENGVPVRRMVVVDSAVKDFELPCAFKPTRLKIDPDGRLPGQIN